jgi:CDP-glucose 4,6-dehydratase
MRILITGHTGFKGSWLSLMLLKQGHQLSGISLPAEKNSLFLEGNLSKNFEHDLVQDIRDFHGLINAINIVNPDQIFHLAAQPLVLESYKFPRETFDTNFMGTINLLEALRLAEFRGELIVVTTDKVYKNLEIEKYYKETDELGGLDPYSASKSAIDIAVQSWMNTLSKFPISIVRAGNVIGGGDWAKDRLMPDIFKSLAKGEYPEVRNPDAVRPWQHVLDCLNGYILAMDKLVSTKKGDIWNFGPPVGEIYKVRDVVETCANIMDIEGKVTNTSSDHHEATTLLLDSSKARKLLDWNDRLDFNTSLAWTLEFNKAQQSGDDTEKLMLSQIEAFHEI